MRCAFVLLCGAGGWVPAAGTTAPATATLPDRAVEQREVQRLIRDLLDRAEAGGRRTGIHVLRFDGIAWEAAEGERVGTSAFAQELSDAVRREARSSDLTLVDAGEAMRSKGVIGAVLRGGFALVKTGVRVSLALVDPATDRVLSESVRVLQTRASDELERARVLPPDPRSAAALAGMLTRGLQGVRSDFTLRLSTERGDHAAYLDGDTLRLIVQSDRDCYLRLYHLSWSEKAVTLVVPNRSERACFLTGGAARTVPDPGSGAVFVVAPPWGVDAIVAVASTTPFADEDLVAAALDGGSAGSLTQLAGDFLREAGIDERRAVNIAAKGLVVRYDPAGGADGLSGGPDGSDASSGSEPEPSSIPGAEDAGPSDDPNADSLATSVAPTLAVPVSTGGQVAHAVCFFTSLPAPGGSR